VSIVHFRAQRPVVRLPRTRRAAPDVPRVLEPVAAGPDVAFLLLDLTEGTEEFLQALTATLDADPKWEPVSRGRYALYRRRPPATASAPS
jgi:hypothetical protein